MQRFQKLVPKEVWVQVRPPAPPPTLPDSLVHIPKLLVTIAASRHTSWGQTGRGTLACRHSARGTPTHTFSAGARPTVGAGASWRAKLTVRDIPPREPKPAAVRAKDSAQPSIIDIEKYDLRTALGQHVGPGHEQAVLGAGLEMKARAAGPDPDLDAGQCRVLVRVDLLEYVDGASTGRINPLSRRIEPEVVDAEDAGKRGNDPA